MSWHPFFGAVPGSGGTRFGVWAPRATRVTLEVEPDPAAPTSRDLTPRGDGTFEIVCPDVRAGARYRYRLDGGPPFPDPASRFQPDGVHGDSQVIDPAAFRWSHAGWPGVPLADLVVYEAHVGTFTREGTFAAAAARLPYLKDLGVTALELMPIADFPGRRNWGYDGGALFAPARSYGTPDDLRRLVDAAHALGIAVLLDVVYNHLGPDGAYLAAFAPDVLSQTHRSPWGAGINLDGPGSGLVRRFFIENAMHWLEEYRVDGLRLDATHALVDDGPTHFLAELAATVRADCRERPVLLVPEDNRNLAYMVRPVSEGGWGFDAVWADDFHHQARRLTAGDNEGYYSDFTGTTADLATTIRQGWFYCGQRAPYFRGPRGTPTDGVPRERFVVCLQNHDQVGNRAFGERLHHQVDLATWRALSTLLACVPETPLLFMGQEWAATSPFLFFTDHDEPLGRLVRDGRRQEFQHFAAFTDPVVRERIPDPQAGATFARSRLDWAELAREPHASIHRLYKALLSLRCHEPALRATPGASVDVAPAGEEALLLRRGHPAGPEALVFVRLRGAGPVSLRQTWPGVALDPGTFHERLSTEAAEFAADAQPPTTNRSASDLVVEFARPGAVVLVSREGVGS